METLFVAYTLGHQAKITDDIDCAPPDARYVREFKASLLFDALAFMQADGYHVELDTAHGYLNLGDMRSLPTL